MKKDGVLIHQESRMFPNERLAHDWATRLEAKITRDGPRSRKLDVMTLGQLISRHAEARDGVKPLQRSVAHTLSQLEREFRSEKLSALTSETFTRFALRRSKEGVAGPVTIKQNLATVRAVLNAAKPMFGLDINGQMVSDALKALASIGAVASSESRTRRCSDEELDRLCRDFDRLWLHPATVIPMAAIVRLLVALPRRREEITEMLWEDYDPKAATLHLRDTKNPVITRNETIPVPPAAAKIINALPKTDARILPYKPESISASFQRACKRLDIHDLRLHDLRHEGITRLFEQGLDIPEVAIISGHMSWATLKRYTNLTPAHVLAKLNAHSQKDPKAPAQPA
jgi:integrase